MKKVEDIIIYSDERYHSAMPSAFTTPGGEVLVAFRRAPDRRRLGVKSVSHVDPNSQAVLVRSSDGGKSWSGEPELICAHPFAGVQDPCLAAAPDGTLLCTCYGWAMAGEQFATRAKNRIRSGSYLGTGGFILRSNDDGSNWSAPQPAPALQGSAILNQYGAPLPCFNRGALASDTAGALYWSVTRQPDPQTMRGVIELLVSKDSGRTWRQLGTVAEDSAVSFNESSLLITPSGDIACFIRSFGLDDHTVVARSSDGGLSFSWADAGWRGHPHHALALPDGRVLLVYGYRHEPIGVRARLLDPECRNVETTEEIVLRDDGGNWDVGYPWATVLPGGDVLVVYYINIDDGVRHIAGTILQV